MNHTKAPDCLFDDVIALREELEQERTRHREFVEELEQERERRLSLSDKLEVMEYRWQTLREWVDGEIEEAFYRRCIKKWAEEQAQIRDKVERHEKANLNYIEQGIKLLELAENSADIYRTKGQEARAELIRFVMPDSLLARDIVRPVFKPPFDIIRRLAGDARKVAADEKTAVPSETARLVLLPGLDSNFGSRVT